ncbi:FxsA family protein [Geodermatophilus sp. YIM 151500]|uniref:FxsA family protein n=1 Tax=Geodermatophilus sp. YIM 151500 TaxID=2984531 RepID=UPI0021E3DEAE|nr:FxsA family protein [Geodermatophilus sp. YIM 151500]MCV2489093.1 FxsA family protein [Geodermatophilus sp. YIM 151500]
MGRRVRLLIGLLALVEAVVFVLVAAWIGVGWTLLAALATTAVGWALLARQGSRALAELRERTRSGLPAGRALGDTGLVAAGGLLMVLPGFVGDLVGLLCLLPGTRGLVRGLVGRAVAARLPDALRGPVRVHSARAAEVRDHDPAAAAAGRETPRVVEGEVAEGQVVEGQVVEGQVVEGQVVEGQVVDAPHHRPSS